MGGQGETFSWINAAAYWMSCTSWESIVLATSHDRSVVMRTINYATTEKKRF